MDRRMDRMVGRMALAIAALVLTAAPALTQDLVVQGGRVISMSGADLDKGSVLIEGGRIKRVARRVTTPDGVAVLRADNGVILPGFVLAHTNSGMDRSNEAIPVVPYVSVLDSVDPSQTFFENSLRDGHLSLNIMPGRNTVIGGTGMVLKPYGLRVEDMTVSPMSGMKISLMPGNGNRAAHWAQLRKALDDGKLLLENQKASSGTKPEELTGNWRVDLERLQIDRQQSNLIKMLNGEITAFVECGTAGDVVAALKLETDYGIKVRLVCHPGTWRAAKYLGEKKVPVILTGAFELEDSDPDTGKTVTRIIPKIFYDAGVTFAVTEGGTSSGGRYLWYQAASLVRYGIPRDVALKSVTSTAAELIGLGDRKGSLVPGKDGDLIVLTDDPLSGMAWVDYAVVGGEVIYDRRKDPRLAEVFQVGTK